MTLLTTYGLIGITGLATCGKDLLLEMLKVRGEVTRFALADNLKKDLRPFLLEKFGIDINVCSPEQKEMVRPIMVSYGKVWRIMSGGTHWTKMVEEQVTLKKRNSLVAITDIRYSDPEFIQDEVAWIKEMGGILIHLSRYSIVGKMKKYILPPNSDEAVNDPILKNESDFKLEWPTTAGDRLSDPLLNTIVDELVQYLNEQLKPAK